MFYAYFAVNRNPPFFTPYLVYIPRYNDFLSLSILACIYIDMNRRAPICTYCDMRNLRLSNGLTK